ncbi:PREDICTED: cation/H(+) antiporter 24-like [Tarenaya hassleriana]|uniref:cation/H(+) antiporter 24-like n=1 Tax=Tarenaya hassleriana TaxID=28532 RepID=UPI00053C945C|nr:PREDICTED: cation/H(+) antiporter 24-like [Tarenaya hassleriana]
MMISERKAKSGIKEEVGACCCMVRVFPGSFNSPLVGDEGNFVATAPFDNVRLPVVCRQSYKSPPFGLFRGHNPLNYPFSTFLLDAIAIIFFIKAVSFLLRPLRQPRIVSEIIGGMIIGPSLLGQNRRFNYNMFPRVAEYTVANIGLMGFMYFLFITGVKTDIVAIRKSPRKHMYIATIAVIVPFVCVSIVGLATRHSMEHVLKRISALGGVASSLAITSFPVIYTVLHDTNLLNSEVGKFAMSVALLGDFVGIFVLVIFEAWMQWDSAGFMALIWYFVSVFVLAAFMLTVVRRALKWIIRKTPQGKPVDQSYIVLILLAVMFIGFLTDMFGLAIAVGPIWLGLLIPDGPPLGATLVARSETIIIEFLMPFSFALVGLHTNVYLLTPEAWPQQLGPLCAMSIAGYVAKFVSTTGAALLFKVPARDSFTLGLVMNLRGQIEILLYLHWIDKRMIGLAGFTLMVLQTLLITGITGPVIAILYDPTRPYRSSNRRTIQHTPPCSELGLVLAISHHETLVGLLSLLDFAYPTISSPFAIFAVQLVELVGRATPIFIDHEEEEQDVEGEGDESVTGGRDDPIQSGLRLYQERRAECVNVHAYTTHAPKRLMYRDICEIALAKQTSFILLPYQKERLEDAAPTELLDSGMTMVNDDVLAHAPCSVCIYHDKGRLRNRTRKGKQRLVVLFLGGADNREALNLAERMTRNPDITLTVIRFLSFGQEGDDEREKKLDDGVVTWFWVKNEANERIAYKEVIVKNGAETLAAIQAMNANDFDLWITGRREGINPKLLEGLTTWSEDDQLGVIGDTVSVSEFASHGSVLVVQQQVRNHNSRVGFFSGKFSL